MREATFKVGASVPANLTVWLNGKQAEARRHLLTPKKGWHKPAETKKEKGKETVVTHDPRLLPFTASEPLTFKAGETIGVEGALDRVFADALGIPQEEQAVELAVRRERREADEVAKKLKAAAKVVDSAGAAAKKAQAALDKIEAQAADVAANGGRPVPPEKIAAAKRAVEVANDRVRDAKAELAALNGQEA